MSSSLVPASPRPKHARGVYLMPSPRGTVRVQAIDSRGNEIMQITVLASLYEEIMAERMRALLDRVDPVRRFLLISPRH